VFLSFALSKKLEVEREKKHKSATEQFFFFPTNQQKNQKENDFKRLKNK
jgi:hypothetical protein